MDFSLSSLNIDAPLIYLIVLIALLAGASFFVVRQVIKTRNSEVKLLDLQVKISKGKASSYDYYQLGSLLLDKKLFAQASRELQKALKSKDLESGEPAALVYNALGYAYAAQEQYDLAIRHYKDALKQKPDYVTALNNLGFSYERKQLTTQALQAYEQALELAPDNTTAQKRAESMRKRIIPAS